MSGLPRDLRHALKVAEQSGWTVTLTKGNHLMWKSPTGKTVITSKTTGYPRSIKNALADLKKNGLDL